MTDPELWFGRAMELPEEEAARLDAAADILDELAHEFGSASDVEFGVWGWAA